MLRGQANRLTYVKQLLRDSCCETVDELQRTMKNRAEWARVSHTTSSSELLRSLRKWMNRISNSHTLPKKLVQVKYLRLKHDIVNCVFEHRASCCQHFSFTALRSLHAVSSRGK